MANLQYCLEKPFRFPYAPGSSEGQARRALGQKGHLDRFL